MRKIILMLLGLLVVFMFLVGCAKVQRGYSEEQLKKDFKNFLGEGKTWEEIEQWLQNNKYILSFEKGETMESYPSDQEIKVKYVDEKGKESQVSLWVTGGVPEWDMLWEWV